MEIVSDKKEMIFKYSFNDRDIYSLGLSRKNMDGSYAKGYIQCKFQKNINLDNKTLIKIKSAWLDFFIKDKKTIPYIFINDFDIIDSESLQKEKTNDPYEQMGEEIELNDDELPF